MKAILYNKNARPDRLVYTDVEKPVPADNELLVKVHAASINAADYRSMKLGIIPKKKIFGSDVAGTVEQAGKLLSFGTKKMLTLSAKANQADLALLAKLAAEGTIKPVIDRRFPLNRVADAMGYLRLGHAKGKVVINVVNGER